MWNFDCDLWILSPSAWREWWNCKYFFRPRIEPVISHVWSSIASHHSGKFGVPEHTPCCGSDFDVVRNILSVSDADRSDEIPYRYQGCFIVVIVECLCIFCDVVIPKIISLLFPIICRRSWMSLYHKDRGYSFYDAMNSRLSFMYFSRNGGIRDVVHSVVTFFFL